MAAERCVAFARGVESIDNSVKLDSTKVPVALISLLPIAEKWGVGDDIEREQALSAASRQELELLVHSIDEVRDEDLFGWLSGSESYSAKPSNEYVALTALTMSIDFAKIKLRRLQSEESPINGSDQDK